jgi:hypothetical protein
MTATQQPLPGTPRADIRERRWWADLKARIVGTSTMDTITRCMIEAASREFFDAIDEAHRLRAENAALRAVVREGMHDG